MFLQLLCYMLVIFIAVDYVVVAEWKEKGCYATMSNESNFVAYLPPRECVIRCKEMPQFMSFAGIRNKNKCFCFPGAQGMQQRDKFSKTCTLTRYRLEFDVVKDITLKSNVLIKDEDVVVEVIYYQNKIKSHAIKSDQFSKILSQSFAMNKSVIPNNSIKEYYTETMKVYTIKNHYITGFYKLCINVTDLSSFTLRKCFSFVIQPIIYSFNGKNNSKSIIAIKVGANLNISVHSSYLSFYTISIPKLRDKEIKLNNNNESNISLYFPKAEIYDMQLRAVRYMLNTKIKEFWSYLDLKRFIFVQFPISKICLETQRAVSGIKTKFSLRVFGSLLSNIYDWYFDGKFVISTDQLYLYHTLFKKNIKEILIPVKVIARNFVSRITVRSYIMIHENLSGIKVITDNNPVLEGSVVSFRTNLNISSASIQWLVDGIIYNYREFKYQASAGMKNITVIAKFEELSSGRAYFILYVVKKIVPFQIHYNLLLENEYKVMFSAEFYEEQFVGFNNSYNPTYTWNFGDGKMSVSNKKSYIHQYLRNGSFEASLNISNFLSNYKSNVKVILQKNPCNTQIFFPWKYKVSKKFLLSETIHLIPVVIIERCQNTIPLYQWTVLNKERKVVRIFKNKSLTIPAKELGIGFYSYQFKVDLKPLKQHFTLLERYYNGSFYVNRTGLRVIFKHHKHHTHLQLYSRSYTKDIIFDASLSYDIDEPSSKNMLKFKWMCFTIDGNGCFKPSKPVNSYESPLIKFNVNMLIANSSEYYFEIEVSKKVSSGYIFGNASIILDLQSNLITRRTLLDCESCEHIYQPSRKVARFHFNCPGCQKNDYQNIKWTLYRKRKIKDSVFFKFKKQGCIPPIWPEFESAVWNISKLPTFQGALDNTNFDCYASNPSEKSNACFTPCSERFFPTSSFVGRNSMKPRLKTFGINHLISPSSMYSSSTVFVASTHKVVNSTKNKSTSWDKATGGKTPEYKKVIGSYELSKINYMTDVYPDNIKDSDMVYSNNKSMLYIKPSALYPGYEYLVKAEIQQNGMVIGSAKMFFTVKEPPKEGECEVLGEKAGKEFEYVFSIKCWNYESSRPLIYTVERKNEQSGNYDVLLISYQHYLTFMLHYSQQNGTHEQVSIKVSVEDIDGEKVYLCPITLIVNSTSISTNRIDSSLVSKMKYEKSNDQSLNFVITAMQKLYGTIGNHGIKKKIFNQVCLWLIKLPPKESPLLAIYVMRLLIQQVDYVKRSCIIQLVNHLKNICKQIHTFYSYKSIIANPHFTEYSYYFLNGVLKYYQRLDHGLDHKKSVINLIFLIDNMRKIANVQNKIDGFYLRYELETMKIYGIKQILYKTGINIASGFSINLLEDDKSFDNCFDVGFYSFPEVSVIEGLNSTYVVLIRKCWKSQLLTLPKQYYLRFPVKPIAKKMFSIKWGDINHHAMQLNYHPLDFCLISIVLQDKSENNVYFSFKVSLRDHQSRVFVQKIYNGGSQVDNYNITMYFPASSIATSIHKLQVEIIPLQKIYRRKINPPWFNYSLSVSMLSCRSSSRFLNSLTNRNFCVPSAKSRVDQLNCRCNSSGSISGDVEEVSHVFFLKHKDTSRKTSYLTMLSCFAIVLVIAVLMIFYSYINKKSSSLNFLDLPENHPCDYYEYHFVIETGHMSNAGTSARVCAILYGTNSHSEKMEFTFQNKKMFQRCSVDCIAIRCPQHLGELTLLKLWHDSKGNSPDWYIKQITISDKFSGAKFYFPLFNWLSFTQGLKQTSIELGCSSTPSNKNMQRFCEKFLDYHIWLSILFGEKHMRFTKVERLSIILGNILFVFVASDLFLNQPFMREDIYLLGLLHIQSWQIVYTAVVLLLSMLPVHLILSFIFRNTASYKGEFNTTLLKKTNKVADSYRMDSVDNYSGAMFYQNCLEEQMILHSVKNNTPRKNANKWEFQLSYSHRLTARVLILFFILSSICYIAWRSANLSTDCSMKILQLVFVAMIIDLMLLNFLMAFLHCLAFVIFFPPTNSLVFFLFHSYLNEERRTKKEFAQNDTDSLYVRNRTRFLRYAKPYSFHELKRKKHKKQKKEIVKKCLGRLLFCVVLLVISVALFEEEVGEIEITPRSSRKSLLLNITNTGSNMLKQLMEQQVLPLLNSTMCNRLYKLENIDYTQDPLMLNPVLLQRDTSGIREAFTLTCGRDSSPDDDYKYLESESWFSENVTSLTIRYNLLNKRRGKNIYSMVTIQYRKLSALLNTTVMESHSVHYEEDGMKDLKSVFMLLLKVILLLFVFVMVYNGYERCMQYGFKNPMKIERVLNIIITMVAFGFFCVCVAQCIVSNLYQTSLNAAKINIYEVDGIFEHLHYLVHFSQITRLLKGALFFSVLAKSMFLLKLLPTNFNLFNVLSVSFKDLLFYLVVLFVIIIACSHIWFTLILQSLNNIFTYANVIETVALNLARYNPRLFHNDNSSVQAALGLITSLLLYLTVRVSVIFYIGVIRQEKNKNKKIATFQWLFNNRASYLKGKWRYLRNEFWSNKQPMNFLNMLSQRKRKSLAKLKLPKKYVLDEIDYQSEELLYRVNKLAEIDDDIDYQIIELFYRYNNNNLIPNKFIPNSSRSVRTTTLNPTQDGLDHFTTSCSSALESLSTTILPSSTILIKPCISDVICKHKEIDQKASHLRNKDPTKITVHLGNKELDRTALKFRQGNDKPKYSQFKQNADLIKRKEENADTPNKEHIQKIARIKNNTAGKSNVRNHKNFQSKNNNPSDSNLLPSQFSHVLLSRYADETKSMVPVTDALKAAAKKNENTSREVPDLSKPFTRPLLHCLPTENDDAYISIREKLELLKSSVKTVKPNQVEKRLEDLRKRDQFYDSKESTTGSSKCDSGFNSFDLRKQSDIRMQFQHVFNNNKIPSRVEAFEKLDEEEKRKESFDRMLDDILSRQMNNSYLNQFLDSEDEGDNTV